MQPCTNKRERNKEAQVTHLQQIDRSSNIDAVVIKGNDIRLPNSFESGEMHHRFAAIESLGDRFFVGHTAFNESK